MILPSNLVQLNVIAKLWTFEGEGSKRPKGQDHTLSQKYPVFRPSGNQSVLTLEPILLCVFPLTYVSTPFLFVHTEPGVFICVPMN